MLLSAGFMSFYPLEGVQESAGSAGNDSAKSDLKDFEWFSVSLSLWNNPWKYPSALLTAFQSV